jgi:hypothetical protein
MHGLFNTANMRETKMVKAISWTALGTVGVVSFVCCLFLWVAYNRWLLLLPAVPFLAVGIWAATHADRAWRILELEKLHDAS